MAVKRDMIVENPKTAELLLDLERLRLLEPFMRTELTIKQAAALLKISENLMFRRVKQFERHGLIEVSRIEARAGKAMRFYKCNAENFFVPFKQFALEEYLKRINDTWQRKLERALLQSGAFTPKSISSGGLNISKGSDGSLAVTLGLDHEGPSTVKYLASHESPAVFGIWLELNLQFSDAKALQRELIDLQTRYAARAVNAQHYIVRLAIAPSEP